MVRHSCRRCTRRLLVGAGRWRQQFTALRLQFVVTIGRLQAAAALPKLIAADDGGCRDDAAHIWHYLNRLLVGKKECLLLDATTNEQAASL